MAYRIEGNDIVIDGFEQGIADTPFAGIADMRNVDITSFLGEASVNFSMGTITAPPVLNNIAYTADSSTDRLTIADASDLYEGCAISLTPEGYDFDSLVVAGGGGGGGAQDTGGGTGMRGGGGGSGDVIATSHSNIAPGAYSITVGTGGAGGIAQSNGSAGTDSSLASLVTAKGGGYGAGGQDGQSKNGGSGGSGGGAIGTGTGGTSNGAGNAGGNGAGTGANGAGAGGGPAGVGANGIAGGLGGAGGGGTSSSISGSSVTYGGGGGGATNGAGGGQGGAGGNAGSPNGANGASATGYGGGGGGALGGTDGTPYNGGAGSAGVVIIAYPTGTMNATGGTITTSGGNTIHTFTTSGTFTILDLAPSTVYYVRNLVGNTFQLSVAPQGSIYDIPFSGSGTLTVYQYGNQRGINALSPVSYYVDRAGQAAGINGVYLMDGSNYAWAIFPAAIGNLPAYHLIFLGNIGGIGATSDTGTGIAVWNDYILLFGSSGSIDVAELEDLLINDGPAIAWDYTWQGGLGMTATNNRVGILTSQEDGNLYWTSTAGLGSIIETPGDVFDPSDSNSYSIEDDALLLPSTDRSTCIAELGQTILIGGRTTFVYVWDKVSQGYSNLLNIPDIFVTNIVATSQNAYVFAGNRGRIYITNGSGIDLYKKLPDYITGTIRPFVQWLDASFSRNQLYFTFVVRNNAGTVQNTVAGTWAIDLESKALRLLNKLTNSGYTGTARMSVEMPLVASSTTTQNTPGDSLIVGWYSGTTYTIDIGQTAPYANYEAFIETDMMPVGTYLNPLSPAQVEWKTDYPIGANGTAESIRIYYRTAFSDSFTLIGTSTATGSSMVGTTTGTTTTQPNTSDYYKVNFQKAQWVQLRVEMSSNATTPTYNRLTQVRLRNYSAPYGTK